VKTKSLLQKSRKKLLLAFLHLLNFNKIGCKQCNENGFRFCFFQIPSMNIRQKLFARLKSEIQIREIFFRETGKSQNPRNYAPTKIFYLTASGDVEIEKDFVCV